MIEILQLEHLVAFAEYGTLSKAAEELHISQPTLTRSMKKIEEEFRAPLFDHKKTS
ncbi:MAG: LysR family transcriptional regulator [Roseburia sp.]|nr:LysR family transcriptional regulator [Roseburia sp.]